MPTNKPKLLIIPGDGIGHEVIPQAIRVVEWFQNNRRPAFDITESERAVSTGKMGDAVIESLNRLNQ